MAEFNLADLEAQPQETDNVTAIAKGVLKNGPPTASGLFSRGSCMVITGTALIGAVLWLLNNISQYPGDSAC